jgi:hypothetical protein
MTPRKAVRIGAIAACMAAALPGAVLASHGKAGLWEITIAMNMPNMPQMAPAQMAQMQAMGMHMPTGHTTTVQRCMTAQEVASDSPPAAHSKDCTLSDVKLVGHTFSADEVCHGQFEGQGQFSVTYDGDEHYTGTTSMIGSSNGLPMSVSNSFEGKWVSADCGGVQ